MFELVRDFDAASPENREELRRFLAQSWMETYPEQLGREVAEAMVAALASEDLDGGLRGEDRRILVLRREGEIVGSCVFAHYPARLGRQGRPVAAHVWFWYLYLRRSAQRQGLGRRMLREIFRSHPEVRILRAVALKASLEALRFYEALGFAALAEVETETAPGLKAPALFLELNFADREPPLWTTAPEG